MDDETIREDTEAEAEALVQEMEAEIDGPSNAEELETNQTERLDNGLRGRLKSDQGFRTVVPSSSKYCSLG